MPKVTKRPMKKRAVPKRAATGGAASRIQPVNQVDGGFKICLYGLGKTGKTRLACTFPKPLLLIGVAGLGTEKGTRSVSTTKGVDFIGLESTEEIKELIALDRYQSFVLDTAGGLQERVVNEYTNHEATARKDWRHVDKSAWGPINSKTIERLRSLLDLADFADKHVVIIAHERTFESESSGDLVMPHVSAALTPGVSGWLNGAVDYIGQTYIRQTTTVKKIAGKEVKVKTGGMEYCLRVGPDPVYTTGFRVPTGVTLPDAISDPTYRKINALIKGE